MPLDASSVSPINVLSITISDMLSKLSSDIPSQIPLVPLSGFLEILKMFISLTITLSESPCVYSKMTLYESLLYMLILLLS